MKSRSKWLRSAAILICCLLLTPLAQPAELKILASVYPVYLFTKNVVKNVPGVTLDLLISPQGGHIHDYTLTPADLRKIGGGDLFIINGAGLETFLTRVKQEVSPHLRVVDTSRGIELIADEKKQIEKHLSTNPHIFTSPQSAIIQVKNIAAALQKADKEHAPVYRKNAAIYTDRLAKLAEAIKKTVASFPNKKIITYHNAFAYFARDMGLEIIDVIAATPGQEAVAGELADLVRLIRRDKIKAVFAEPQYSARLAKVLARESGATLYFLDPLATGSREADSYVKVMEQNRQVLLKALGKQ